MHTPHPDEHVMPKTTTTDPTAMATLRKACPSLPFLVPGVGAQGGDPQEVLRAAGAGPGTLLVNSSRAIIYASAGPDFAEAARRAAEATAQILPLHD